MDVLVVEHPLVLSRLTAMRDVRTDSAAFRAALHELTTMLVYEAARSFPVERYQVQTPVAAAEGARLAHPPLLVPVLRAGLGMADAALALLPESSMGFVGLARDEQTFQPRAYMESRMDAQTMGPIDYAYPGFDRAVATKSADGDQDLFGSLGRLPQRLGQRPAVGSGRSRREPSS